jgi:hypothetical protein
MLGLVSLEGCMASSGHVACLYDEAMGMCATVRDGRDHLWWWSVGES